MLNSVFARTFYSILTWIMFTNIRSISFSSQWNIGPQSSIHFFAISSSFHNVSLILLMSLIVFIIVAFLLLCFCNQVADEGCISSIYLKGKQYRPRRLKKEMCLRRHKLDTSDIWKTSSSHLPSKLVPLKPSSGRVGTGKNRLEKKNRWNKWTNVAH